MSKQGVVKYLMCPALFTMNLKKKVTGKMGYTQLIDL